MMSTPLLIIVVLAATAAQSRLYGRNDTLPTDIVPLGDIASPSAVQTSTIHNTVTSTVKVTHKQEATRKVDVTSSTTSTVIDPTSTSVITLTLVITSTPVSTATASATSVVLATSTETLDGFGQWGPGI